jgi:hypothetical protein
MSRYYVVRVGADRFDLRQSRFADALKAGTEHPHDLMAVGFSGQGMRDIIAKFFPDTDVSALDAVGARDEFLRDIAITAVEGGIGYWARIRRYRWGTLDNMLPFPEVRIVPAEAPVYFTECDITRETIEKGLAKLNDPAVLIGANLRGTLLAAAAELDAGNIDADGADAIVQLGLFGELVFG